MALQKRPPVITIMGHVDHGKTSLLDYIRKANVQAKESGGITQHIGAYQINYKGKPLTFIDTPGHAAFSKMRERGANITDIIILVVALNDGVKPQTIESIRHIKNSKAQVIVAINKSDLKGFFPDMVKGQLAEHGITVTDFGGDIDSVDISATTGMGVDKLLETLTVMADLAEYKADPKAPLQAVVIESTKDKHRGSLASVIVREGTLKVKQDIYSDAGQGRVKSLVDENGKQLKEVGPGSPAEIVGLNDIPAVGSIIREVGAQYEVEEEIQAEEDADIDPFADLDFGAAFGEKQKLNLIIKADVEGTLEVIEQNMDTDSVNIISKGVGQVTESDIESAITSGAKIISFKIKVPNKIKQMAKDNDVVLKSYDVIYKLIEDMQKQILKLIEPTIDEVVTGEAEILQMFDMKGMKIAGCKVKTGELKKTDKFHLKRDGEIISDPQIGSMMHGKEEITSVKGKSEFALTFKHKKQDFQVGDILVAYHNED
ncbi:MAG: translation initiation factor IF-2 [Candidatus Pacebacteria bacterium]|nr:translation initiation factor IF-2 [Candidatus Paceibacterota bacterium]